jgi:glucose/arabinose dehydrogenase
MSKFSFLFVLLLFCFKAQSQTPNLQLSPFATGFSSITSLAHCNDDRLFVVQQRGRIRIVDINTQTTNSTDFLNISSLVSSSGSERGLLGLAFHPEYLENGYFFVYYTNPAGSTVVSRFRVSNDDPNVADPESEQILLTFTQPYSNHNGGCIEFGKDGYLYIASGDGGSSGDPQNYAQNNLSLLGKMLRIDVDNFSASTYSIPASNPFASEQTYLPEIWATGLRNPWRFSFDKLTGDMWIGDVGQNVMEEINFQPASSTGGENYGWRCYEGVNNFNTNGCADVVNYTFPVFSYLQSGNGCSVTGGYVYRGALFNYMYGRYFLADYCSGRMWSLLADGSDDYAATIHGNFVANNYVAFGEDRYGELYVAERGRVMKIAVDDCTPVSNISATGALTICDGESKMIKTDFHPLLSYQWFKNNDTLIGATTYEYEVTEPGNYFVEVTRGDCSNISDTLTIAYAPQIAITFALDEKSFCLSDDTVLLSASPEGGMFSGQGVVGDTFLISLAGVGEHIITYSYSEPGFCESQISDTIQVFEIPEVTLNGLDELYCIVWGEDVQLEYHPLGGVFENASNTGVFSPQNFQEPGIYVVTYTYTNENNCTNSVSLTTELDICGSVNDNIKKEFSIYPTPARDILFLKFKDENTIVQQIEIYNLMGKKIEAQINNSTNPSSINLPADLKAGVYFVRIAVNGETFSKSFVISE